ncbi:hypothetical protein MKJ04_11790 [Pontibacter sp. E15-1]|uniref:hypothetical protein n=1 Tax=Pontibacter sp. E15-1 TaxID=2919918 RepID=UPI001F501CDA|nr:hypothetical protein [Pontibacter sp. E15-1]MCJ8165523.1 hypothetical protein [Pontibacter sp. E15-1]
MDKEDLSYRYSDGDGEWHTGVYTYSYVDWLEGKIPPEDVSPLIENRELSSIDGGKIYASQCLAYLLMLRGELEYRVLGEFLESYTHSFLKKELVEEELVKLRKDILLFKERLPEKYYDALLGTDGRTLLTSNQIHNILNREGEVHLTDGDTTFEIIVKFKHLDWLTWLSSISQERTQEYSYVDLDILAIDYCDSLFENDMEKFQNGIDFFGKRTGSNTVVPAQRTTSHAPPRTFQSLFKHPKQAEKILKLVEENLSSTGQWITEPRGRYLVALYCELQAKGYLIKSLSAPIIAVSFKNQFDVQLSSKVYQPQERNKANDYRDYFKHIPPCQPSTTA